MVQAKIDSYFQARARNEPGSDSEWSDMHDNSSSEDDDEDVFQTDTRTIVEKQEEELRRYLMIDHQSK